MLDALTLVEDIQQFDAEVPAVLRQIRHLPRTAGIGHRRHPLRRGRVDVIDHRQRRARPPDLAPGSTQTAERLRAGVFVDHLAIDIQQHMALIVEAAHGVRIDVFVVEGSGVHQGAHSRESSDFHHKEREPAINCPTVRAPFMNRV
jgi:hypothetical protein